MTEVIFNLEPELINNLNFEEIIQFYNINNIGVTCKIPDLTKLDLYEVDSSKYNFFTKLNIKESDNYDLNNFKKEINSLRRQYHLISAEPRTPNFASFAVRDNRVDIIKISAKSSIKIFNAKYSKRLIENDKILEIDISFIYEKNFAKQFRSLLRIIDTLDKTKIKFILTNTLKNLDHIRSYQSLCSFGKLLGINKGSMNPKYILHRIELNKNKINGSFIGNEIQVVEEW